MDYAAAARLTAGPTASSSSSAGPANDSPKQQRRPPRQQHREQPQHEQPAIEALEAPAEDVNGVVEVAGDAQPAGSREISGLLIRLEVALQETGKQQEQDDTVDVEADESEEGVEAEDPAATLAKKRDNVSSVAVQQVLNRRNRVADLASYLLRRCEDPRFEVGASVRFFRKGGPRGGFHANNNAPPGSTPLQTLDVHTLPHAMKLVQAVMSLLKNESAQQVPTGDGGHLSVSRFGADHIKVARFGLGEAEPEEFFFKIEDFAIRLREQVKFWVKLSRGVDEVLAYREERAQKESKDDLKKRRSKVSEKMHLGFWQTAAKTLKELFADNSAVPQLSAKFKKQQERKHQAKTQMRQENKAMMMHVLAAVPKEFLEANVNELVPPEEEDEPAPAPTPAPAPAPQPAAPKQGGGKGGNQNKQQQGNGNNQNNNKQQQGGQQGAAASSGQPQAPQQPRSRPAQAKAATGVFLSQNPYEIGEFSINHLDGGNANASATQAVEKGKERERLQQKQREHQQKQQREDAKRAAVQAAKQGQPRATAASTATTSTASTSSNAPSKENNAHAGNKQQQHQQQQQGGNKNAQKDGKQQQAGNKKGKQPEAAKREQEDREREERDAKARQQQQQGAKKEAQPSAEERKRDAQRQKEKEAKTAAQVKQLTAKKQKIAAANKNSGSLVEVATGSSTTTIFLVVGVTAVVVAALLFFQFFPQAAVSAQ